MKDLMEKIKKLTDEQQEQILSLVEESLEVKDPMEFDGGQDVYLVDSKGVAFKTVFRNDHLDTWRTAFGNLYHTKEQAETASKAMRRFNRILQFAILHGGYREFKHGIDNYNYFVFYDEVQRSWGYGESLYFQSQEVFMTKECAVALSEKLNSGEYTL